MAAVQHLRCPGVEICRRALHPALRGQSSELLYAALAYREAPAPTSLLTRSGAMHTSKAMGQTPIPYGLYEHKPSQTWRYVQELQNLGLSSS